MKGWQSSTMPRYRKSRLAAVTIEQKQVFAQCLDLLKPYEKLLVNKINAKDHYELWTNHSFRSQTMHPKNKRGRLFAGLIILKKHVGFYFYPLHISAEFHLQISSEILGLYKGGSAFHFTESLSDLELEKFKELLSKGWSYYQGNGWVPSDKFPSPQ